MYSNFIHIWGIYTYDNLLYTVGQSISNKICLTDYTGTQNKKSGLYLGSHYHIPTYFGSLNTNLNSENLPHPSVLSKSPNKLQTPKIVRNSSFNFKIDILLLLCILITLYLRYIYSCRNRFFGDFLKTGGWWRFSKFRCVFSETKGRDMVVWSQIQTTFVILCACVIIFISTFLIATFFRCN